MPVVGLPTASGSANGDAALGAGLHVEGIVAGAGGDQQLQVGEGFDHLAREGGALPHADHDGKSLQGLDDGVRPAERRIEDLDFDVFGDCRPVGHFHRNVLVVVQNGGPNHAH